LSYLHRFPLDCLKIDQSFVASLMDQPESRQIITTIISLAEGLRMEVVAEGIECSEQADELRKLGCHMGQGYLFSKPITAASMTALLEAGGPMARRSAVAA
jgi:EAL domain-containing protein (putative c-di-GMP-specific phosphodiesterase class I)